MGIAVGANRPEVELVVFDRGTCAFFGVLLLFLALGTAFAVHGSSIGVWYEILGSLGPDHRSPDSGVLLGHPRWERIDEWNIFTPAIVSQATVQPSFPIVNGRWGPAQIPLVYKFPARHWSMIVRPQLWGFFALDLERAFAFYWDIRAVLLLGGVFLLLKLLTGNDFGISLLGALWVFFSGFVQWWYSNQLLPECIGCVCLLIVAGHYLVLSRRAWVIALAGVAFLICASNFALALYPPYQVPLLYLGIAVGAASLVPRLQGRPEGERLLSRAAPIGLVTSAVGVLLVLFYRDSRDAVELMRATIYPGSRLLEGGDLTLAQVFGGFFGFFMTEQHVPPGWENVCEASNFVLLFPVPMAILVRRWWAGRAPTSVEWALVAYIVVLLTWTSIGWPRWLAFASGFGRSQPLRSLLGVGLASIVLCCRSLARPGDVLPASRTGRLAVGAGLLAASTAYALHFERVTSWFATPGQIALVALFAGATSYLLLARRRAAFALCILVPQVWSYGLVNPVAVGLGPVLKAKVLAEISSLVAEDPEARWVAYVDIASATFLKVAGARVFNGINIIPPVDDLRVLDPEGAAMSVYNRSGYILLTPEKGPAITWTIVRRDLYRIGIDPKSDAWRRLGIRYVALPAASADPEFIRRTELVRELPGLWIYRYRGASRQAYE